MQIRFLNQAIRIYAFQSNVSEADVVEGVIDLAEVTDVVFRFIDDNRTLIEFVETDGFLRFK